MLAFNASGNRPLTGRQATPLAPQVTPTQTPTMSGANADGASRVFRMGLLMYGKRPSAEADIELHLHLSGC